MPDASFPCLSSGLYSDLSIWIPDLLLNEGVTYISADLKYSPAMPNDGAAYFYIVGNTEITLQKFKTVSINIKFINRSFSFYQRIIECFHNFNFRQNDAMVESYRYGDSETFGCDDKEYEGETGESLFDAVKNIDGLHEASKDIDFAMSEEGSPERTLLWFKALHKMGQKIEDLKNSTEEEFLYIGTKLQSFFEESKKITSVSVAVAELISSERITAAIEGLNQVSSTIEDIEKRSRRHTKVLGHLQCILDSLLAAVVGLQSLTTKSLNVLCIATRMESAHLTGDRSFDTLSNDIKDLVMKIQNNSEDILRWIKSLQLMVSNNMVTILEVESRQSEQTRTILGNSSSSLSSLQEKRELSLSATKRFSLRMEDVSGTIRDIVISLQFHDITRQLMEHVGAALQKEIPSESGTAATSPSPSSCYATVYDLCEIQSVQLQHAHSKFTSAVEEIIVHLQGLAKEIGSMSQEAQEITCGRAAGESFLCTISDQLSTMKTAFHEYGEAELKLSATMRSLGDVVNKMSMSLSDIKEIGTDIEVIALNAIIQAHHTGNKGKPLSTIANSIRQTAFDAREQTSKISEMLRSVTSAAQQLCGTDDTECLEGIDRMSEDIWAIVGSVQQVNDNISMQLGELSASSSRLMDDIKTTIKATTVHRTVTEVCGGIILELTRISDEIRNCLPAQTVKKITSLREEFLKSLESSYTMQSERNVHRQISASIISDSIINTIDQEDITLSSGAQKIEVKPSNEMEENWGDNVELF